MVQMSGGEGNILIYVKKIIWCVWRLLRLVSVSQVLGGELQSDLLITPWPTLSLMSWWGLTDAEILWKVRGQWTKGMLKIQVPTKYIMKLPVSVPGSEKQWSQWLFVIKSVSALSSRKINPRLEPRNWWGWRFMMIRLRLVADPIMRLINLLNCLGSKGVRHTSAWTYSIHGDIFEKRHQKDGRIKM